MQPRLISPLPAIGEIDLIRFEMGIHAQVNFTENNGHLIPVGSFIMFCDVPIFWYTLNGDWRGQRIPMKNGTWNGLVRARLRREKVKGMLKVVGDPFISRRSL